jgi:hypothetical protein
VALDEEIAELVDRYPFAESEVRAVCELAAMPASRVLILDYAEERGLQPTELIERLRAVVAALAALPPEVWDALGVPQ